MYHTKVYQPSTYLASCSQEYDPKKLHHATFKNSVTDAVKSPLQSQEEEKVLVFISSAARDVSVDADPANFTVTLDTELRNVKAVRVLSGLLPNTGAVSGLAFILLDSPEMNHIQVAGLGMTAAAILQPETNGSTGFLKYENKSSPVPFKSIKDRVHKLHFTLKSPTGTQIVLGNDTVGSINAARQWTCLVEFTLATQKPLQASATHAVPFV